MSNLFESIDLSYPNFIWTHTGWIQGYEEVYYDKHAWDNSILDVHIVLFSHMDPGIFEKPGACDVTGFSLFCLYFSSLDPVRNQQLQKQR